MELKVLLLFLHFKYFIKLLEKILNSGNGGVFGCSPGQQEAPD